MTHKTQYKNAKEKLLKDPAICERNRRIFERFFEYQEYKLKRMNRLIALDESTYKTLCYYVYRLRTVDLWFEHKAWEDLTRDDIKWVYDAVEDGRIRTSNGRPFRGTEAFFRRIMRGKPFALAGKKELAVSVMEFYSPKEKNEVRFIPEVAFRQLVEVMIKPEHKAFFWLAWDIGENGYSLLQLRKRDFVRQVDRETNEPEYSVNLLLEILKRSRTPRSLVTNYQDTVRILDVVLRNLGDDDLVFAFGTRMATKALDRAVWITGVRCSPGGQKVSLKDLRSSMACDLLNKGWTTDEVNYRLGHRPSSREIDKYVTWLALDQQRPKRRVFDSNLNQIQSELEETKRRDRINAERVERQQEENAMLRDELETTRQELMAFRRDVEDAFVALKKGLKPNQLKAFIGSTTFYEDGRQ